MVPITPRFRPLDLAQIWHVCPAIRAAGDLVGGEEPRLSIPRAGAPHVLREVRLLGTGTSKQAEWCNGCMSQPKAPVSMRLYGSMQHLLAAKAQGVEVAKPQPRNVVQREDAVNAISSLAAAIDELAQTKRIAPNVAAHMASMLMVARDYIQPLPPAFGDDGATDLVTPDLREIVDSLRTANK